jgi:heptosyltransferase-2
MLRELRRRRFDIVVDLRNSLLRFLVPARKKSDPFQPPPSVVHMKDRHSWKVAGLVANGIQAARLSIGKDAAVSSWADDLLRSNGITAKSTIVVIAPGARSITKRWPQEYFLEVIDALGSCAGVKIVLMGDSGDREIAANLVSLSKVRPVDISGVTTLAQASEIIRRAGIVITNDSANLHIASYLDVPVIGIFGPTDDAKYGSWSSRSVLMKKEIFCRPCRQALCRFGTLECLRLVKPHEVILAAKRMLGFSGDLQPIPVTGRIPPSLRRILIIRTDRIGDMIISTPVIKALRRAYPGAYIAVLVRPYTVSVIRGNPYIDEVIVYDKKTVESDPVSFFGFVGYIRSKKFDITLVLHPTNRVHLLAFLAGIPRRVGYDRKLGWLLTDRLPYTQVQGKRHQRDYMLDIIRHIGIEPGDLSYDIPVDPEAERWARDLFEKEGLSADTKVAVLNPGASCPSKIWPAAGYAAVGDYLAGRLGFKVIVLGGPQALDVKTCRDVIAAMKIKPLDLAGKVDIPQTASLFRRVHLVISADTGPMHIASAVSVPLVVIFGRNQAGLSPLRWGPVNANSRVLHRNVGCVKCLAHDCTRDFACLKAITVEDVIAVVRSLIG